MSPLVIKPGSTSHSAYNLRESNVQVEERHTLSVLVDNEPGVLARVIGLFSGRGYNIDSLTVAETDHASHLSRITIVTTGTPQVIVQIKAQLGRLVPVHDVQDLTVEGAHLERELALIKVVATDEGRVEALRMADLIGARVVDVTLESFVFELARTSQEIDEFIDLMRPLGLAEVTRTGVCAMLKGSDAFKSEEPQPEPAPTPKMKAAKSAAAR